MDTGDFSEELNRSALSLTNAKKQGFLNLGKGVRRNWKKRWFILQGEYLYYFLEDGSKRPKGVIPLVEYSSTKRVEDKNTKWTFKIIVKEKKDKAQATGGGKLESKNILLGAGSEKERDEWLSILETTLEGMNNVNVKYGFGGARTEYSCYCKVFEAKLANKEEVDSYCTIFADKIQKGRTNPVFSSSCPAFDQEYEFELENPITQYIIVQLKDQSKKKDNVIGQVAVPLSDLEDQKIHETWFKMTPGKTTVNPTGTLKFSCVVSKNKLKIDNLKGDNLTQMDPGGFADPYLVVSYGNKKEKTIPQKRTINPQWPKQTITFDVNDDKSIPVVVEAFHDNRDGTSDFMGEVQITLQQAMDNGPEEKTLHVQRKSEVAIVGDMRIALQTRRATILPDKHYDDLFALLMANSMSVTKKLAAVSNKKEKPIAECLVKAFEMRRSAVHYIKTITSAEIEATSEPNVIFRGNTVATKSVDMYMRLIGMPYLLHVLKPIVNQISQNEKKKTSCELDEFRLEKPNQKQKLIQKNLKTLHSYVSQIFTEIEQSLKVCPTNFRNIFEHIQQTIQKKWPDHPTAQYTAVAGFIFLRFFCPALLAPKLFNLTTSHPPPNVARDLTLIAKTLQNLANLVVFGKKEPFMHPANQFIEENIDQMKQFLSNLCKPPDTAIDEIPSKRDNINWGREMARVHFHLEDNFEAMEELFGRQDSDLERLKEQLTRLKKEQEQIRNADPEYRRSSVSAAPYPHSDPPTVHETDDKDEKEEKGSHSGDELPKSPATPAGVEPPSGLLYSTDKASNLPTPINTSISPVSTPNVKTPTTDKKSLAKRFEQNMANAPIQSTPSQYSPPPVSLRSTQASSGSSSSRPATPQRNASPASSLTGSLTGSIGSLTGSLDLNVPASVNPTDIEGPTNLSCPGCTLPFNDTDTQFKIALKLRWHLTCFKCITCQKAIDGDFINKGGPQCLECRNHPKTCVRCGLDLNGTFLNIEKKWPYHPTCFTCYFCRVLLNQAVGINFYYSHPDDKEDVQFICDECKKKKKKT